MSGKPSPDSVRAVIDLLKEIHRLAERVRALREAEVALRKAEQDLKACEATMYRHLQAMDLSSPGNAGFAGRQNWFINEMYRQLTERK